MNLLGKWLSTLFRFVFRLVFGLVRTILMYAYRQVVSFIRFAAPHAFMLVIAAFVKSMEIMVVALLTMFRGMGVVTALAENWLGEALAHGAPGIWEPEMRITFRVLAFLTILLGWAMVAFIAVFTLLFFWEYGDWLFSLL